MISDRTMAALEVLALLFCVAAAVVVTRATDAAQCAASVATLQRDYADATASAVSTAQARYTSEVARGEQLAAQLLERNRALDTARDQLKRGVSNVTTVYRPTVGAAPVPLPAAVFTRGFVRLWDAASGLGDGLPASGQAASGVVAAACTGKAADSGCADDLAPTALTTADVLGNHIDNAMQCQRANAQLEALIAWHEEQLQ